MNKKKVNVFGKKVPALLLVLFVSVLLVTAALLSYFGQITGMATSLSGGANQGKTLSYISIIVVALAIVVMFVKRVKDEEPIDKKSKKSRK